MSFKPEGVSSTLKEMEKKGWVSQVATEKWGLTKTGVGEARRVTAQLEGQS